MLSVIVAADEGTERLPTLLAILTAGAVEGLVREVLIAGGQPAELLMVLRDETGAELVPDLASAIASARSDRLLILPAKIELRADWLARLRAHLRGRDGDAVIVGEGGLLRRRFGVLTTRTSASRLAHPDLKGLRRQLRPGAPGLR